MAPRFVLRILALFDPAVRAILPNLGTLQVLSNARAVTEMGIRFIPPDQGLRDAADWLVKNGQA